jgi:hypothetical protein
MQMCMRSSFMGLIQGEMDNEYKKRNKDKSICIPNFNFEPCNKTDDRLVGFMLVCFCLITIALISYFDFKKKNEANQFECKSELAGNC